MRDPQATLVFEQGLVTRHLEIPLASDHPLLSGKGQNWVKLGMLVPYEPCVQSQDAQLIRSPRLPFVSSPEEWCDQQLFDAASLTLDLLEKANAVDADLKDASAWNVIFDGCRPVFCDITSIEPLETHRWWAAGQFVRHFISPLWLAQSTGLRSRDVFRMHRDGALPEMVRQTLGWRRFTSRCWLLVAEAKKSSGSGENGERTAETPQYRARLIQSLRWMLDGVKPQPLKRTTWAHYTVERGHYTEESLTSKRTQVAQWLEQLKPEWVLDMGCNSGEFSDLALQTGSRVIALDGDHDAVQDLYLKHQSKAKIYPVLSALDDIHAGRGWAGIEHSGLVSRLASRADVVLMLAVVHHLAIAASVDLKEVAKFAATCTRRWLIVEWVDPSDSQVKLLCQQRRRQASSFDLGRQRTAFVDAGFQLLEEVALPGCERFLALLEKTHEST
jgi:SAM-dependent methyltransferase